MATKVEEGKKLTEVVISKSSVVQEEPHEKPDEWTCMVSFDSMKTFLLVLS